MYTVSSIALAREGLQRSLCNGGMNELNTNVHLIAWEMHANTTNAKMAWITHCFAPANRWDSIMLPALDQSRMTVSSDSSGRDCRRLRQRMIHASTRWSPGYLRGGGRIYPNAFLLLEDRETISPRFRVWAARQFFDSKSQVRPWTLKTAYT